MNKNSLLKQSQRTGAEVTREEMRDLEERLENWGRCEREAPRRGRSSICSVIGHVPDENPTPPPPLRYSLNFCDRADAELIAKAWQALPMGRERRFLQMVYALQDRNVGRVCWKLGIMRSEYQNVKKSSFLRLHVELVRGIM